MNVLKFSRIKFCLWPRLQVNDKKNDRQCRVQCETPACELSIKPILTQFHVYEVHIDSAAVHLLVY